jgi:peptidoglycan/LPS O-acetylase OafA/YrhL
MTEVAHQRQYYPALDGLRGVAILMVVLLHNFGFMSYFFFGWLGVDLFFVLSGFLITDILLRTFHTKNFLRNFYIRRALRIFPIYYLSLFLCLFIIPLVSRTDFDLQYYQHNIFWLLIFFQNWLYIFNPPHGSSMLFHFWSLAVEEQFYIIWPGIILLVKNFKALLWIIVSTLIVVMIGRYLLWIFHIQNLGYDSLYTFTRIDGICIGCLLALMLRVNPDFLKSYTYLIVLALAGLNFIMYFLNKEATVRLPYLAFIGYTTFAIMFGFLVYEAITAKSKIIQLVFNNDILKFFGRISYGLYILHWPIYLICFPLLKDLFGQISSVDIAKITAALLATAIAVLVSLFSYNYFEIKFLRLKNYFA